MRKLLTWVPRTINSLNLLCGVLAGLLALLVTLTTTYDVIMRYAFHSPTLWNMEISTVSLVLIVFLGLGYVVQVDGHISVDLLTSRLRPRPRGILKVISALFGLVCCIILAWKGSELTANAYRMQWHTMGNLQLPTYWLYAAVPVGGVLASLQYLVALGRSFHLGSAVPETNNSARSGAPIGKETS